MATLDRHLKISESRDAFGWGRHLNSYRLKASLAVANGSILDVGCSDGGYVMAFRTYGHSAFGIDLLLPSVKKSWSQGLYAVAKIEEIPFPNDSFNTVTCFEVLEHLEDPTMGLAELQRVARNHVVLTVPDARRPPEHEAAGLTFHHWLDRTHVSAFTRETLQCLVEEVGLEVERLEGINPVTPEVLVLAQYRLPKPLRSLLLRLLRRLPGRTAETMTLLVVARKVGTP